MHLSTALSLLLLSILAGRAAAVSSVDELEWWQTGVIYQIYPRSYKDTDGDGIGDLKGIIEKLDYIKSLGVEALWLSPIYESPGADMGYDISDYEAIDPLFGTMKDFEDLVKQAHEKGLKVVMDFVVSYTSDEHPWFEKSVNKEAGYEDWYTWEQGIPNEENTTGYDVPNNWLSAFTGSGWEWHEERKQYYFHSFTVKQPDLNYRNKKVIEAMDNVLRFWFDKGVDGFRVDAVPQMAEDSCLRDEEVSGNDVPENDYEYLTHKYTQHQPETYETIQHWRTIADEYTNSSRVLMLETYGPIDRVVEYYGTTEKPGGHFPFNFYFITDLEKSSTAADIDRTIHKFVDNIKPIDWPNWVLGNHDNRRVATRFGPERVDAMNALALLLPGTAITYMGEEIGMEDHLGITWEETQDPWALTAGEEEYMRYSRDPERTPFQWDNTTNAGFSTAEKTWLPVNPNYKELNVAVQDAAPKSHIKMYRKLVELRGKDEFVRGSLKTAVFAEDVFAFARDQTYVVVMNLGSKNRTVDLSQVFPYAHLVYVSSANSEHEEGSHIDVKQVALGPYDLLVLKAPDVADGAITTRPWAPLAIISALIASLVSTRYS